MLGKFSSFGDGELQIKLASRGNHISEDLFNLTIKQLPHYQIIFKNETETEYCVDILTNFGSHFKDVIVDKNLD